MSRNQRRGGDSSALHLGVVDHLGWAIVVAASPDATVVDRRRIELIEPGLPAAPVHHLGGLHELHRTGEPLSDDELRAVIATVRASAAAVIGQGLDQLGLDLQRPIASLSLRSWPDDFPTDLPTQRRAPWEARADPVMYRTALAEAARTRGWRIRTFETKAIEADALRALGRTDDEILRLPRAALGPPWTKDHRVALAATVAASPLVPRSG